MIRMRLEDQLENYRKVLDELVGEEATAIRHGSISAKDHRRAGALTAAGVLLVIAILVTSLSLVRDRSSHDTRELSLRTLASTTMRQSARVRISTIGETGNAQSQTYLIDFVREVARLAIPTSTATPRGREIAPQILVIGGHIYATLNPSDRSMPLAVRQSKHWIAYDASDKTSPFGVENPFATLTEMLKHGRSLHDLGLERVNGQDVRHYDAIVRSPHLATVKATPFTIVATVLDLYVDSQKRLVRLVKKVSRANPLFTRAVQFDFAVYGVAVSVKAPPTDQVISYDEVVPPPPRLIGPWSLAGSGSTSGIAWSLYRAPADHERTCWSLDSVPSIGGDDPRDSVEAPHPRVPPITHRGKAVTCSRNGVWANPIQYVFRSVTASSELSLPTPILVVVVSHDVVRVDRGVESKIPVGIRPAFGGFTSGAAQRSGVTPPGSATHLAGPLRPLRPAAFLARCHAVNLFA
jgi:hypothetical protein